MAGIDHATVCGHGVSSTELMERAGSRVVEALRSQWNGLEGLKIVVVCGKGNNGGDGFVVARLLHQAHVPVRVYLTAPAHALTGAAQHHYNLLRTAGVELAGFPEEDANDCLASYDVVVDCLLGTGLRGAARIDAHGVIEAMNACGRPIVSVDMPSGVESDSGRVHGIAVHALVTVTFGLPKIGQLFYPGRNHCGRLHLVDIGFPDEVIAASLVDTYLISEADVAAAIPRRSMDAHKGTCGSALLVVGSEGMTGAAVLAAETVLRSGAGRVTAAIPSSLNDIMEVKLTEAMTCPLPEVRRWRCLSLRALGVIRDLLVRADVVGIGPGLGTHRETAELVRRVLAETDVPAVVDADGLNALSSHSDTYSNWGAEAGRRVFTPHVGEFCRLAGRCKRDVVGDPVSSARQFARESGVVLVLKGAPTCVGLPDGSVYVNPSGNSGMATAGSGDVLTGMIAGLLAQGLSVEEAACCGVFLHGRAGDVARDRKGEWGMLAGDIADAVPEAFLRTIRFENPDT